MRRIETLTAKKWIIHAAGVSAMAFAWLSFYFGFFAPTTRRIEDLHQRTMGLRSLVAGSDEVLAEHAALNTRLTELRNAASDVRQRMQHSSSQDFVSEATQLASELGLEMELCTAGAPQPFGSHSQVAITCKFRGSYPAICQFFATIDHTTQIAKISDLVLETAKNSQAYPVKATFQLYYASDSHDTVWKGSAL